MTLRDDIEQCIAKHFTTAHTTENEQRMAQILIRLNTELETAEMDGLGKSDEQRRIDAIRNMNSMHPLFG